ncbi:hypothetical protein QYF36_006850 [Acer negundo]|nr:hypothetical protein QYF36_006850 [Acer negundo]
MHRINLLRHYPVNPPQSTKETGMKRQANRDLAMEKLKEGNVNAATEHFQKRCHVFLAHYMKPELSEISQNYGKRVIDEIRFKSLEMNIWRKISTKFV